MSPSHSDARTSGMRRMRTVVSESVVVSSLRRVRELVTDRRPRAVAATLPDDALIRMAQSSAAFHAVSWPGRLLFQAWPDSFASKATARWLSTPLDLRVRLVAIVVSAAVATHVTLTRFRAPQPTPTARMVWIAVLVTALAAAAGARTIAAAWTHWTGRRTRAREGGTA
jgi:hypothetical protein